jgi:hypothetical protein
MPTRYALEGIEQLKQQIGNENLKEVSQKEEAKKAVKKSFEEKFQVSPSLPPSCPCVVWAFVDGVRRERISGSLRLFDFRDCWSCMDFWHVM